MIARGSDGDDLVTRKLGELNSELTDSGTSSVDEDPCFVCPFGRRRVEALGESQFLNSVQGLEGCVEASGSYQRPCVRERSHGWRVGDVRRTGGCGLLERECSLGNLPDKVGGRLDILSESTTAASRVYRTEILEVSELTLRIHRISRVLTSSDGRTDSISNLEIDFEIRSELYDLSCQVTPDVGTIRGEESVA